MRNQWLVIVAWLGLISAAVAAELPEAEALYRDGAMREAAAVARSVGGAEGFALAAKATLVDAVYLASEDDKAALLDRAAEDARQALAYDPDNVDANLQLAIALGHLADLKDPVRAYLDGDAKDGKALIDRALALDPDSRWARAILGIWHLRVVERAGDALGNSIYGASRQVGVERCLDAVVGARWEPALKYGCAVALLELDAKNFKGAAAQALTAVKETPAADAADRLVQSEAERLLAALKSDPQ